MLRKVFFPCTEIWQSLAAGVSWSECIRAGCSEARVALGVRLSPAGCWFSLLCYQRILEMSSCMLSVSNQIFSGWYFLLPLWEMRGSLELRGEAERAQILVFRGITPCLRAQLCSGGYLGGTQLFSVGGNGWEISGHLISRCFSLLLLWSYERL